LLALPWSAERVSAGPSPLGIFVFVASRFIASLSELNDLRSHIHLSSEMQLKHASEAEK
jgi:hypothetical protein